MNRLVSTEVSAQCNATPVTGAVLSGMIMMP